MSFASNNVLCINHHGNKTVGSRLQIIAPDLEYLENLCKAQTSIIVLLPLQLDSSGWLCFGRNTKLLLWQISFGYNWDKSKENSWTNPLDNWESVGAVWLFPWKLFSRKPPPHGIVQNNPNPNCCKFVTKINFQHDLPSIPTFPCLWSCLWWWRRWERPR